jgi:hypothetical protein
MDYLENRNQAFVRICQECRAMVPYMVSKATERTRFKDSNSNNQTFVIREDPTTR